MNQYTKHIWKRNITAFLLACGILASLALVVLIITLIGVWFWEYLPYIVPGVLLFLFVFGLSIPIRYHLKDMEDAKFWRDKKEKERLLIEADMEMDRLKKEADKEKRKVSEQIRAAHAVRKRDNLI